MTFAAYGNFYLFVFYTHLLKPTSVLIKNAGAAHCSAMQCKTCMKQILNCIVCRATSRPILIISAAKAGTSKISPCWPRIVDCLFACQVCRCLTHTFATCCPAESPSPKISLNSIVFSTIPAPTVVEVGTEPRGIRIPAYLFQPATCDDLKWS